MADETVETLNAAGAKEIADKKKQENIAAWKSSLQTKIMMRAEEGYYYLDVLSILDDEIKSWLEELGYQVSESTEGTLIKWD